MSPRVRYLAGWNPPGRESSRTQLLCNRWDLAVAFLTGVAASYWDEDQDHAAWGRLMTKLKDATEGDEFSERTGDGCFVFWIRPYQPDAGRAES